MMKPISALIRERTRDLLGRTAPGASGVIRISAEDDETPPLPSAAPDEPAITPEPPVAPEPAPVAPVTVVEPEPTLPMDTAADVESEPVLPMDSVPDEVDASGAEVDSNGDFQYPPLQDLYAILREALPETTEDGLTNFTLWLVALTPRSVGIGNCIGALPEPPTRLTGGRLEVQARVLIRAQDPTQLQTFVDQLHSCLLGSDLRSRGILWVRIDHTAAPEPQSQGWSRVVDYTLLYEYLQY